MLVLTRKLQEQIRVGDDITITVLRIKGNTVRVGIEAPRGVRVVRGELPSFDSGPAEGDSAPADPTAEGPSEELSEPPLTAFRRARARARQEDKTTLAVAAG
jgi:carbon storage regulator CsrA